MKKFSHLLVGLAALLVAIAPFTEVASACWHVAGQDPVPDRLK